MARTSSHAASSAARSHFVVDGSNIATEGRNQPSLHQLNEAVLAFMEEHPDVLITVVVDATFGHRIDKKEVKEFDAAVANNELVTPPAGAVGRGDAFVLSIANKAKASVLSNDSFQEFHGTYDWLFDPGRLIGGKPVPHVGWVFVERSPVRGPKSRQAVKDAKRSENGETEPPSSGRRRRRSSSLADGPVPVPTAPPPGPARTAVPEAAVTAAASAGSVGAKGPVNELVPFLDFVERHPVGTSCTAVVESYSSHGAYARSDSVLVYIPLRLMDDPPPRSARSRLRLGEAVTLVVVGYAPERRSVDAALPHMAPAAPPVVEPPAEAKRKSRRSKAAAAEPVTAAAPAEAADAQHEPQVAEPPAEPKKRSRRPKAAATEPVAEAAASAEAADTAPEPATPVSDIAEQPATPAERAPSTRAKKAPTKKAAAKKPAKKAAKAPAKKVPAKKVPAKKVPAKKAAAQKAATKQGTGATKRAKAAGASAGRTRRTGGGDGES